MNFPQIITAADQWIVVSKPASWLTIPGRASAARGESPVLSQWLEKEFGTKVWVVHRIDRETSGVVVFARTAEAHRQANEWFQRHQIRKAYDFLALGKPTLPVFKISLPIEGAHSTTQVEVKERFENCFLGRAIPVTGRRHQIRIHLSEKGHPLLGDVAYRGPKEIQKGERAVEIERVALHAAKLELPEGEVFEAPWPADFRGWVEKLRASLA